MHTVIEYLSRTLAQDVMTCANLWATERTPGHIRTMSKAIAQIKVRADMRMPAFSLLNVRIRFI